MVACCIPWTVNKPAFRSSVLNSFISRLLFRVHAADSNEHHAVLSVASAISKAATGSTHFFFSAGSLSDAGGVSDCGLMRSSPAPFVHALQHFLAHDDEEKCYGQTHHQIASKCFKRPEQPPFFRQEEIAVTESRVGHAGKIKCRLEVWQTLLRPEKQCPDRDLN